MDAPPPPVFKDRRRRRRRRRRRAGLLARCSPSFCRRQPRPPPPSRSAAAVFFFLFLSSAAAAAARRNDWSVFYVDFANLILFCVFSQMKCVCVLYGKATGRSLDFFLKSYVVVHPCKRLPNTAHNTGAAVLLRFSFHLLRRCARKTLPTIFSYTTVVLIPPLTPRTRFGAFGNHFKNGLWLAYKMSHDNSFRVKIIIEPIKNLENSSHAWVFSQII